MTRFFAQTTDKHESLATHGGPIIPFAMLSVGSAWDDGLRARDLWNQLAALGIHDRAVCMYDLFAWSFRLPQQHQKNQSGVYPTSEQRTTWEAVADLWSGRRVDVGAAVYAMRRFTSATHAGKAETEAMRPDYVHDMFEGDWALQYFPADHPVHTKTVPLMNWNPAAVDYRGMDKVGFRAEAKWANEAMKSVGWAPNRLSKENMYLPTVTTLDSRRTMTMYMYEPGAEHVAGYIAAMRKWKSRLIPWIDGSRSDFAALCPEMKFNGIEICGVYCGDSNELTPPYTGRYDAQWRPLGGGLQDLAAAIKKTWPGEA